MIYAFAWIVSAIGLLMIGMFTTITVIRNSGAFIVLTAILWLILTTMNGHASAPCSIIQPPALHTIKRTVDRGGGIRKMNNLISRHDAAYLACRDGNGDDRQQVACALEDRISRKLEAAEKDLAADPSDCSGPILQLKTERCLSKFRGQQ